MPLSVSFRREVRPSIEGTSRVSNSSGTLGSGVSRRTVFGVSRDVKLLSDGISDLEVFDEQGVRDGTVEDDPYNGCPCSVLFQPPQTPFN